MRQFYYQGRDAGDSTGRCCTPINNDVLKRALDATCKKRGNERLKEVPKIISTISDDAQLHTLWKSYQKKYPYAADISYSDVMESIKLLCLKMQHISVSC